MRNKFFKYFWLLFLTIPCVNAASIELYSEEDYTGAIPFGTNFSNWEEKPLGCFNFPRISQKTLSSVKANGHCVIFFDQSECKGLSIKINQDVSSIAETEGYLTNDNFDDRATSLRACDEYEGGDSVDVDFFNNPNYEDLLLTYSDICRCIGVPEELKNVTSIDNHHSCIRLYSSKTCNSEEGIFQDIFAGRSTVSADISAFPIHGKFESFRACETPQKCSKLTAEIYAFNVTEDLTDSKPPVRNKISMGGTTVFRNNGGAMVSQLYQVLQSTTESLAFEKIEQHRRIESWSLSESSQKDVNTGFVSQLDKFSKGVNDAYGYECNWSESEEKEQMNQTRELHIVEDYTEYNVTMTIQVPPCSTYEMNSFINVVENYPLKYTTYFRLSGFFASQKITAAELREELTFMKDYRYNHTIDDFTIAAAAEAVISMTFSEDAETTGIGTRIPNCYA